MTTLFRLVVLLLCSTLGLFAQDFQGVATYKTQRSLDIKIDSTQVGGSEIQQQLMDMLKKEFQKTYLLTFDKTTSLYKQDEELAPPSTGGGMVFVMADSESAILHKNFKTQSYVNQVETFGKQFIIKDSIPAIEWTLHDETKNIGTYTCFKATHTKEVEELSMMTFSSSDHDNDVTQEDSESPKMITQTVTAWYTPQIPISNGPDQYHGLPGLILEVNDGDLTILCSKITLNPKKTIDIQEPKKGKQVTQSEYDAIMLKKMEEMDKQFRSRNSDENSFEIRIGG